jgi:hypothetical protein
MHEYQSQAAPVLKRMLAPAAVAIALCALWSALVVTWALMGVWTPIAPRGDTSAFMVAAVERVKGAGIGNCALALSAWRARTAFGLTLRPMLRQIASGSIHPPPAPLRGW